MGCWGITAFESDAGLDAVGFIRDYLPEDGKLDLEQVLETMGQDSWNAPSDVTDGESHTSPMALAEVIVKFLDHNLEGLDYDGDWAEQDQRFSAVTSFTAPRDSVQWLRGYISDTLKNARENAAADARHGSKWGGWFEEKDWLGWQDHMEKLVSRLDMLLAAPEGILELITPQGQENGPKANMGSENSSPDTGMNGQMFGR